MQLSFKFTFAHADDEVHCCYTVPYSYTELTSHLEWLKTLSLPFATFTTIGKSIGGIDIPLIKIGTPNKPVVMIVGRQHPGETHSSFIIHGLVNFLLSKNRQAH